MQILNPLNPTLNAHYTRALNWSASDGKDPLPAEVRTRVNELLSTRNSAPEDQIDAIDRKLVDEMYYYVLRPDEIAKSVIDHHRFARVLTIDQATVILAALGEQGYPIAGNGAPDYANSWNEPAPVRGEERNRVIWEAARYWAEFASRPISYVSLGDCRGFCTRVVQYDQPGSMNSSQRAALTLGPAVDRGDQCDSHGYMRRHTRKLLLVRAASITADVLPEFRNGVELDCA
jgi:hypothetical protein